MLCIIYIIIYFYISYFLFLYRFISIIFLIKDFFLDKHAGNFKESIMLMKIKSFKVEFCLRKIYNLVLEVIHLYYLLQSKCTM